MLISVHHQCITVCDHLTRAPGGHTDGCLTSALTKRTYDLVFCTSELDLHSVAEESVCEEAGWLCHSQLVQTIPRRA